MTEVASLVSRACLLEAQAPKPGNVYPGRPFRDMRYEDFAASAAAIGPVLGAPGARPLGETILAAVRATRAVTRANTNLGIILLLAPLARAAGQSGGTLPDRLRTLLAATTVADAELAYQAIREAWPSGLGSAATEDVARPPSVTLLAAMALAADRDAVAAEWAQGYARTFAVGAPALRAAVAAGLGTADAVVETYLALLASAPDTLIARKLGPAAAGEVTAEARAVREAGGTRSAAGRAALAGFDSRLRDTHNSRNPGTTADLTAAALFVVMAEDGWSPDDIEASRAQ